MKVFIKNLSRRQKRLFFIMLDAILVYLALIITFVLIIQAGKGSSETIGISPFILPSMFVLMLGSGLALGIYDIKLIAYENKAILRSALHTFLLSCLGFAANYLFGFSLPVSFFIVFGLTFYALSISARLIGLMILQWIYNRGEEKIRVLVYGAGSAGVQLVAALRQSGTYSPIAFIDDNMSLHNITIAGLKVYPASRLNGPLQKKKIDKIFLAMPALNQTKQNQIAQSLSRLGYDVQALPSFAAILDGVELVDTLKPIANHDLLGRAQLEKELPGGSETYQNQSIMVTGAGGSIGAELCRQILSCRPRNLIMIDHSEAALYAIDQELAPLAKEAEVTLISILGSVTEKNMLVKALKDYQVDTVFHAAAYKHVPMVESNEASGLKNNVLGTKITAEAARLTGVKRFILISSDKAVRPANVMGASKRMAELVVQDLASRHSGTIFSMVRFGNVLGSSGSVIPLFKEQIAKGGPITITHSEMTRYFMTIPEAVRLVLVAGGFARGGDVFVLDMGKPVLIYDLARRMIELSGYKVRDNAHKQGDIEIVEVGPRPGEKLYEELLIGADMLTTPHSKILRAQEKCLSEIETATMLKDLRDAVETGDRQTLRNITKRWVEGYHQPNYTADKSS